jgi:phenylalanyl-tRNA synthetase beta chain
MKYSLKWLKELVPFQWKLDELCERLTMAGVEVEGIATQGGGLDNVVVAQILKSDQHPNADRLSVCEVESGSGKKQIVCGAKNYKVGDKIPLALPGAKLPNGMEIKRSKLRGVESEGMMCSAKELALAEDAEGLLILPPELQLGIPIVEALHLDDTILDLEITPNRPDLLSHFGLAREIAALGGLPAPQLPLTDENRRRIKTAQNDQVKPATLRLEDAALCPRYTARVIRGVKVGPSPDWLRARLESLGHRSISNVVDITNYVLEEMGQPLHAFDLDLLDQQTIVIRKAAKGEKLERLDDETSELQENMLVIADATRPAAIAGVMGGKPTGVSGQTRNILLESATFQPSSIRKTSKTLMVSTDSSYRFERGVDENLAPLASDRAAALILELCGGEACGPLQDEFPTPSIPPTIRCRRAQVNRLLGIELELSRIQNIFESLGCKVSSSQDEVDTLAVVPPGYRQDLAREVDLIEEVSRVYGIGNIRASIGRSPVSNTPASSMYDFASRMRGIGTGLGMDEAAQYTVVASDRSKMLHPNLKIEPLVLANPLSSDMDSLRPSLLGGLLAGTAHNLAQGNEGVALFELGTIFRESEGTVGEDTSLAFVLSGKKRDGASWEKGMAGNSYDFHDLRGVMDEWLASLDLGSLKRGTIPEEAYPFLDPKIGFIVIHENLAIGVAGKIKKSVTQSYKISPEVYFAELNLHALLRLSSQGETKYKPWPVFPAIQRDIALTVSATEKHQTIENAIQRLAKAFATSKGIVLQKVELFDIFLSEKIGNDKKSLAYSLTYRSPERTLTDQEVNTIHDSIKKGLRSELSCEIRE